MILKRLYNVLRANISSGESSGKKGYNSGSAEYSYQNNQNYQKVPDPEKEKELKYLSNLELEQGATFEEIRHSYKSLIKKYHPDKFHTDEEKRKYAEDVTSQLNQAYAYFEKKYSH